MQNRYEIRHPVYTHRGEELLPPGTVLDEKTLAYLKSIPFDRTLVPYGFHDLVRNDLSDFLTNPPYDAIFNDRESIDNVLSTLGRVRIPKGAFEVTEFFREKDFYTYRHMLIVFAMSTHINSILSGGTDARESLTASPAHDIGKCSIPLELLQKSDSLTRKEKEHIEHHTLAGYALVHYCTENPGTVLAANASRDHHERSDGSGYPAGLAIVDRSTEIIIVSDIYDALVSPRPYRVQPFDNRTALEELSAKALMGKINRDIVQALIASNRKTRPSWHECAISSEKRGMEPPDNKYGTFAE